MFSLNDALEIVKPHHDRIAAEQFSEERERKISALLKQVSDLQSALGCCAALMESDIADGTRHATPTRMEVIAEARKLSRI